MQTFLPYQSFVETFQVLDHQRLRKQSVEGYQLLKGLVLDSDYYWNRHPASKMWKGHEPALIAYTAVCSKTCLDLGFKNSILEKLFNEHISQIDTSATLLVNTLLYSSINKMSDLIKVHGVINITVEGPHDTANCVFELPDWYRDLDFFDRHKCQLFHKDPDHYEMFESYKGAGSYKWPVR